MLGVENSDLLLVDENEEETLVEEKALIDRKAIANVEAIEFDLGRCSNVPVVRPDSQLHSPTPSDCKNRVSRVSVDRREALTPVQIRDDLRLNVVWPLDRNNLDWCRSDLGQNHPLESTESNQMVPLG